MDTNRNLYSDLKALKDTFDAIDISVGRFYGETIDELMQKVLTRVLSREPVSDDAKSFTLFTREGLGDPNMYLTRDGKLLGVVHFQFNHFLAGQFGKWTFTPTS